MTKENKQRQKELLSDMKLIDLRIEQVFEPATKMQLRRLRKKLEYEFTLCS